MKIGTCTDNIHVYTYMWVCVFGFQTILAILKLSCLDCDFYTDLIKSALLAVFLVSLSTIRHTTVPLNVFSFRHSYFV